MPPNRLIPTGNDTFADPDAVLRGYQRAMRCVCTIENAGSKDGTGVLIARDLILTNYHVVDQLIKTRNLEGVECRFDYRVKDGVLLDGERFNIIDVDIICSPPAPGDDGGGDNAFDDDHVDYAIVRIDRPAGILKDAEGRIRRWIELPKPQNIPEPDLGMRIVMLQHPYGADGALQPLRYDHDEFVGRRGGGARFTHDVTTRIGSSGSPCFATSYDFGFIALHNAAVGAGGERFGQAIPLSRIAKHINKYYGSPDRILGVKPPREEDVTPQRADAIKRRHTAALCLMDRSSEENEFLATLSTIAVPPVAEDDGRPLLHVVVCTEKDAHSYFLRRLQHLSFAIKLADAEQSKIDALKKGLAAPTRSVKETGWPLLSGGDIRRRKDLANLLAMLDVNGRHLLVLSRTIDKGWSAATEGRLLRDFAGMLADKFRNNRDGVQAVVSYIVSAGDVTEALASDLASVWLRETPPHCGVCVRLSEIGKEDLADWRGCLGNAWGDNDEFGTAIDSQFNGAGLKPLDVVASALSDGLTRYISTALDKVDLAGER